MFLIRQGHVTTNTSVHTLYTVPVGKQLAFNIMIVNTADTTNTYSISVGGVPITVNADLPAYGREQISQMTAVVGDTIEVTSLLQPDVAFTLTGDLSDL